MEFLFRFGRSAAAVAHGNGTISLELPNSIIEGSGEESWLLPAMTLGTGGAPGIHTWRSSEFVCAVAIRDIGNSRLREVSRDLYSRLLEGAGEASLYRFWNFIPNINAACGSLDNYQVFCQGRAEAFERSNATLVERVLPAASAVGTPGNRLCVVMFAGSGAMYPIENALQTPAYRYPEHYGPSAPSFARASSVDDGSRVYVSGTASIRRSESMHRDDTRAQLDMACDNIGIVTAAAGCGDDTAPPYSIARVYLRNPGDWPLLADLARTRLATSDGAFNVIQADICRSELRVEAEAFLSRSTPSRLPG